MKKALYTMMLVALMTLVFSAVATAAPYYHGDFDTDSTGCAKCHVTHAAEAEFLLVDGPTQTDFCYFCHASISKSPYDARMGKIKTASGNVASLAGGFEETFDFDNTALTYDNATDADEPGNYLTNTSMHGVEKYDGNAWISGAQIPGGSTNLTGTFRCGSCHDPHAGGSYPAAGVMPRLLKTALPAVPAAIDSDSDTEADTADFQDWTVATGSGGVVNGEHNAWAVGGYGDNVGFWCAGCHDIFNQTQADAGHDQETNTGKYMHRMNFAMTNTVMQNGSLDKIALSTPNSYLTCLTCHRAHGTASDAEIQFFRADNYLGSTGDAVNGYVYSSSVLLRQQKRDVCYDCHGAATNNTPDDQTT